MSAMRIKQNVGVPHTLIVLGTTLGTIPTLLPTPKTFAHGLTSVGTCIISVHQEVSVVVIVFFQVVLGGRRVLQLVTNSIGGWGRLVFASGICGRTSAMLAYDYWKGDRMTDVIFMFVL